MRFSHEVPKQLLQTSRFFNDFDYALDILFDDDEYYNFFKESIKLGREVWLDNSLYERRIKGIDFDIPKYIEYIEDLNPSYYIVPDAYESSVDNIALFNTWLNITPINFVAYSKIVVVHGSDYDDYVRCYKFFNSHCKKEDIIAFSGGDTFMSDRASIIKRMYVEGVINENRKHHLLGSTSPHELKEYRRLFFITSIDTSLPVMSTYEDSILKDITEKPKTIVHDVFNNDRINIDLLYKNISYYHSLS